MKKLLLIPIIPLTIAACMDDDNDHYTPPSEQTVSEKIADILNQDVSFIEALCETGNYECYARDDKYPIIINSDPYYKTSFVFEPLNPNYQLFFSGDFDKGVKAECFYRAYPSNGDSVEVNTECHSVNTISNHYIWTGLPVTPELAAMMQDSYLGFEYHIAPLSGDKQVIANLDVGTTQIIGQILTDVLNNT